MEINTKKIKTKNSKSNEMDRYGNSKEDGSKKYNETLNYKLIPVFKSFGHVYLIMGK